MVTAYDEYAVRAFEMQAVDYVLKPVQPARLQKSVRKLRQLLAGQARPVPDPAARSADDVQAVADRLRQLLAALQPAAPAGMTPLRQLPVATPGSGGQAIRMVPIGDVLYLQAADKYVRVVTAAGEHLLRTPLRELLPRLDADRFWQIHRATLVRADAIDAVERDDHGKLRLRLVDHPDRLVVSRLYAHRFKAL